MGVLGVLVLAATARPAIAQISQSLVPGLEAAGPLVARNTVAYDSVHEVYLVIVSRPPVVGRFLDKNGNQIGPDFPIALESGQYTAWASIAFGGPANDPAFLVTYTLADLDQNPKYGRLVRFVPGGGSSVGPASWIASSTSEWVHSEKAQNVWDGQRFIVGTRVMAPGMSTASFQVNKFEMNGSVSGPVNLGDGNDYYGSPALACASDGTCLAVGFMAGINTGYSGGSYARLFDSSTLLPRTNLFYLSAGSPNEDQQAVYQAHTGRFLTEWFRGTNGGVIDTRLVNTDGTMSTLDFSKSIGPGAGCNAIVYNPGTHTTLLVTKGTDAALFAMELGDDGYPINPNNTLLITNWDGLVLDYEPSIGANVASGQWLVTAQLIGRTVGRLIQGVAVGTTQLPISISTSSLPTATQNTPYSGFLSVIGGTPSYTWNLVSGSLPPGLNLVGASLVGTPTTPGTYGFRVRVTGGDNLWAEKDLTVQVNAVLIIPRGGAGAHISQAGATVLSGLVARNNVAYDPVHQVYLVIVARPPVTGRFLDKNGVQIGPDFPIALEPDQYTAWASIAFGGPSNDPAFLVTYTLADLALNPKFGRLVRYVPGSAPTVSNASFITNATSEWLHSEKGQNVWNGQRFIVGTRVMPAGMSLSTFQVNSFEMNGAVSAPVILGDGADYYGSPAIACATNGTCLTVGFKAGINTGYSGGSYARLFDANTLAPRGNLFFLAAGKPNEDQAVVYQTHTGRFLTEWFRGTDGGVIDTRVVATDGMMSALDLTKGFAGPGAGTNAIAYNPATQTTLLVTKDINATQIAIELGDDGYPLNTNNFVHITNWDGVVLDYEPSIGVNPSTGQWLVTAQLIGATVAKLVQGNLALAAVPVQNGGFSNGLIGWNVFGGPGGNVTMNTTINNGVLEFYRTTNVSSPDNSAVVLQSTGAAVPANTPMRAQFDLGNSSPSRKRIAVLLHDLDFSDLQVCSFWLEAGAPLRSYVMRMHSSKAWANATVSFYAASDGGDGGAYRLDNIAIAIDPTQPLDRTDCVDPAAPSSTPTADGPELVSNGGFNSNLSGVEPLRPNHRARHGWRRSVRAAVRHAGWRVPAAL